MQLGAFGDAADAVSSVRAGGASSSSAVPRAISLSAAMAGRKRGRQQIPLKVHQSTIAAALGPEAVSRVPSSYQMTFDSTTMASRILSFSEASGRFSFFGETARSATVVPDISDPAYDEYTRLRRQKEKEREANKRSTRLETDEGVIAGLAAIAARAAATGMADTGLTGASGGPAGGAAGGAGGSPGVEVAPASSIYEMFERQAYWGVKDMVEATGKKEADIRAEVLLACDYMRSGPHRGTYRLKPEYRTVSSAAPDVNDGIEADE